MLSKRPEMFLPSEWPAYFSKCKGATVWDLDGRKYIDVSIFGVGACILGYADPDVEKAVLTAIRKGTMSTLNCPEEVELAELLCELHPWAKKVRFARSGGEALAIAVRIARAFTGRDVVAFCGYHGWHDWYLSSNLASDKNLDGHLLPGLEPCGVPRSLFGTAIPFHYQNKAELEEIARAHKNNIAAIVMEPARSSEPDESFLSFVREKANEIGAVLIFDEVTSGWRETIGGIHLKTNVVPDMAVFAKGMSNGYPMSAVIGIDRVMDAAQSTFISSTYWTERIGPAAALATIKKLRQKKAPHHLMAIGKKVQAGWRTSAFRHNLKIKIDGIYPLSHFIFDVEKETSMVMKTLFTQILLEKGFLASTVFYASLAHTDRIIEKYLKGVDVAFEKIRLWKMEGSLRSHLIGPVSHSGFSRLT